MELDTQEQVLEEIDKLKKKNKNMHIHHQDYGSVYIANASMIAALITIYPQLPKSESEC